MLTEMDEYRGENFKLATCHCQYGAIANMTCHDFVSHQCLVNISLAAHPTTTHTHINIYTLIIL